MGGLAIWLERYIDPATGAYVWPEAQLPHETMRYSLYGLIAAGVLFTFIAFYRRERRTWYKYVALFSSLKWLAVLTFFAWRIGPADPFR